MVGYKALRFKLSLPELLAVVIIALLFCAQLSGAETLLTLEEAVEIALEKSYSMKSLQLSLIQSEENWKAAKYRFRTNADMTFSTPNWSERITEVQVPNSLPVYNSRGTLQYQGRMNVNQPLPTDGRLSLRSNLYQSQESNYYVETDNTIKRRDFFTSLSLNFSQPLFTYNRLQTGLKRTELGYERTSLNHSREKLNLIYTVTGSFYSLYRSAREYEINRETLEQRESAYELARLKYEAGLIPEVEALEAEVDMEETRSSILAAEATLELQKDQFKHTIGLDLSEDIGVKTDIIYKHFDIDLDKALEEGLKNRFEIRENAINIELQEINVTEAEARSEIYADLNAFYNFTGFSDQDLPLGTGTYNLFDSSWEDLQRRPGNRGITLTFYVPVWDWGVNKAEVASAKVDLRRAELQIEEAKKTIINSIRDVVRNVKSAEDRLEILRKRQDIAQRAYEISVERFNNGDITSQELANNNNRLSTAKLAYLNAYISYKLAVEDLKRKILWDFEKDSPVQ